MPLAAGCFATTDATVKYLGQGVMVLSVEIDTVLLEKAFSDKDLRMWSSANKLPYVSR